MTNRMKFGMVIMFLVVSLILLTTMVISLGEIQTARAADLSGAEALGSSSPLQPVVLQSSRNDTSLPLRLLAERTPIHTEQVDEFPRPVADPLLGDETFDPTAVQSTLVGSTYMPLPIHNFEGGNAVDGGVPPDTNGDVGYDSSTNTKYYMQWNNTSYWIWDVTDPANVQLLLGPLDGNVLFNGFGGPCEANDDGDPIILFDQFANRWMGGQFVFSAPYYQCMVVSQTADPTGAWYRYEFPWPNGLNDYPKFGIWPDGYYMSANQFNGASGAGVAALERSQMLVGAPAQFIYFDVSAASSAFTSLLPSDLDGPPPPPGTPNYFASWSNSPTDRMNIWEFHVDWTTPANSTFGLASQPNETVLTANVDPSMCGGSRNCIPQPGGSPVDALAPRLMYRLPYRYQNGTEILVANHTVDTDGTDHAGIHWMELRKSGGPWSMHQESVYAPDSDHRWMGSITMDQAGNIALGYSVSSQNTYPSIRYAGRLAGDPLGVLSQIEQELIAGSGYQETTAGRWGDYSSMTIDPTDDCTFWYTTEYYGNISGSNWQTRIGSFVFPSCLGNVGSLEGAVTDSSNSQPIEGVKLLATNPMTHSVAAETDTNGDYAMILEPGSYDVTATAYGYLTDIVNSVAVLSGTTTIQDFSLDPAPLHLVEGYVTDSITGLPLLADITIQGDPSDPPAPFNVVSTDPATGYYSTTLAEDNTYTFNVEAGVPGYDPESRQVGPLTGSVVEDFALDANLGLCTAPGYSQSSYSYFEDFEIDDGGFIAGTGEWEWGTPTFPAGITAFSGVNVWGTDLDGDASDPPPDAHVVTSTLLTVSAAGGYLQWWDWYGAELGDTREVYVEGTLVWTDDPNTRNQRFWDKKSVDLSPWTSQTVEAVFVLDVRGGGSGPDGWYIDDVSIAEPGTCTPYGVDLPPDMAADGFPDTAVDYMVTITNTGALTDTFDLSLSGQSWSTSLSTNMITLGAGQSGTFMVTVNIPASANQGDDDTVTVTASSQANPPDSDSLDLTTTALERRLYLPIVLKS